MGRLSNPSDATKALILHSSTKICKSTIASCENSSGPTEHESVDLTEEEGRLSNPVKRRLAEEKIVQLVKDHVSGLSVNEVARRHGIHRISRSSTSPESAEAFFSQCCQRCPTLREWFLARGGGEAVWSERNYDHSRVPRRWYSHQTSARLGQTQLEPLTPCVSSPRRTKLSRNYDSAFSLRRFSHAFKELSRMP
jgi:hypothetical protein